MTRRIRWWEWVPFVWRKWRIVLQVPTAADIPDRLPKRGAVLVRMNIQPTWLAFDCPCGNGHRVMLNLLPSRTPRWAIALEAPLTLSPSVDDETDARRCHYYLTQGRVVWVKNDEWDGI